MMRGKKLVGALVFAGVVGLGGFANAAIIGINISGNTSNGEILDTADLGVTSTYQQTHWNNVVNGSTKTTYTAPLGDTGAGGTLAGGGSFLDSSGTAVSGMSVRWAGSSDSSFFVYGSNQRAAPVDSGPRVGTNEDTHNIFNGYVYAENNVGSNVSLEIKGIPYSAYDIVAYISGSGSSTVSTNNGVTGFDGTTGLPTGGTSDAQGTFKQSYNSTWIQSTSSTSGNYLVLAGLSGSDQTITAVSTHTGQFHFNAIQIVPVPEPTSLALLSLGGLALLRRRRRGDEATV